MTRSFLKSAARFALACAVGLLAGCAGIESGRQAGKPFTVAVIPDTQNYLDYAHQRAEGFPLDSKALFIAQMKDIASRREVVFVAAVGDVWQHSSLPVDPGHAERGLGAIANPHLDPQLAPTDKTRGVEIPGAVEGYRILSRSGKPFGVAPGNHDYDAFWSVAGFPPNLDKPASQLDGGKGDLGAVHVGGLDNFRSVFSDQGQFFRGRDWYVDSFRGGANSAQVFEAGGYRFLHIALEMSPDDNAVRWASAVIEKHPRYPTIVTTHDYLNTRGERRAHPIIDLAAADPDHHNSAEQLWDKLISAYDQIFMVLCGHHHGQSLRVDDNRFGNPVYQILADFQGRGQAGIDAAQPVDPGQRPAAGIGDGWYRLMHFDLAAAVPHVRVETWSSHYRKFASGVPSYAAWYRDYEQPGMSDAEFLAADEFTLELQGFRERFADARLK
jgi:hypothetical protein